MPEEFYRKYMGGTAFGAYFLLKELSKAIDAFDEKNIITDPVAKANELCNNYGLDTISTGGAASFLFECLEKGMVAQYYDLLGWDNETGNPRESSLRDLGLA